jgi:hypothetical protein
MIADKIYDVNEIMKRLYNIVLYGVTEEVSKRGVKRKGRRGGVNYVHGERSCDTSEIQQSQNSLTYFCVRRRLCLYHRDFTNTPAIHLTSIIAFWLRPYAIGFVGPYRPCLVGLRLAILSVLEILVLGILITDNPLNKDSSGR